MIGVSTCRLIKVRTNSGCSSQVFQDNAIEARPLPAMRCYCFLPLYRGVKGNTRRGIVEQGSANCRANSRKLRDRKSVLLVRRVHTTKMVSILVAEDK
ncbi:hypothetical protein FHS27_003982 [Rhodopirellula rubra]|uniref:Uncharacterized protein n=1 Tax=Aporhodopirellula rubra TaxID=980271 RepID=A0A7W5E128_9BACT|nr:hypothetical protein [Aporhodopirellula rubra]